MGDIWPYGPPVYTSWQAIDSWFEDNGFSVTDSAIFAAIGEAEASFDLSVINDTPSTGDYSVGTFQINYYGSLAAERTRLFGTPQQLIAGGLNAQAEAAHYLWSGAGGWTPWSTYNSGAYLAYTHGQGGGGGGVSTSGEPTIQEGSSGPAVVTLQTDLDQIGYSLARDGSFGPLTRAAVVDFQGHHGLTQDGIVGPLTWAALGAAVGSATTPAPPPVTTPAAAPPPNEAPEGVPDDVQSAYAALQLVTGPDLTGWLAQIGGYAGIVRGSRL